jgi:hypothetical protein
LQGIDNQYQENFSLQGKNFDAVNAFAGANAFNLRRQRFLAYPVYPV